MCQQSGIASVVVMMLAIPLCDGGGSRFFGDGDGSRFLALAMAMAVALAMAVAIIAIIDGIAIIIIAGSAKIAMVAVQKCDHRHDTHTRHKPCHAEK